MWFGEPHPFPVKGYSYTYESGWRVRLGELDSGAGLGYISPQTHEWITELCSYISVSRMSSFLQLAWSQHRYHVSFPSVDRQRIMRPFIWCSYQHTFCNCWYSPCMFSFSALPSAVDSGVILGAQQWEKKFWQAAKCWKLCTIRTNVSVIVAVTVLAVVTLKFL